MSSTADRYKKWLLLVARYYSVFYIGTISLSLIFRLMICGRCKISKTKRIQYFEIIDEWWCPSIFRQFNTRTLYEIGWKQQEFGRSVGMKIKKIIDKDKDYVILDLCSGCRGPSDIINNILNQNRKKNRKILTILTDLYPEIDSWNELCTNYANHANITYNKISTDATNIRFDNFDVYKLDMNDLKSILKQKQIIRILTSSFHHFPPKTCTKLLYDGFMNNDIMIICDVWTDKSLKRFLFKFIFVVLISGHISIYYLIRFWLFHSKLHIIRRILKCIILIKLWPFFLFSWNHDSAVSEGRFYSVKQIGNMATIAMKQANKKYNIRMVPIFTPKGLRAMNLLICVPVNY